MLNSFLRTFTVLLVTSWTTSCGLYSFSGASISPDVKTVTVNYFPNNAAFVVPTLSQLFTERLKDKFVVETNLSLVNSGGDLQFSGAITKYEVKGIAPTGDDVTALSRLTISVQVEFLNTRDEKQNWKSSFSSYDDYESDVNNLSDVEDQLIDEINEQLVNDIFNKSVVNW